MGCVAYALALVATAPAGLLDAELDSVSGGRLRLSGANGSLWSGAGRLEMRAKGSRVLAGQDLRWRFLPGRLLRAALAFEFDLGNGQNFVLAIAPGQVEVVGVQLNLPATALAALQPKLAPLQLTGEMLLRVERLVASPRGWTGNATLHWRHAGSALTRVSPLGDYELRFTGDGGAAQLKLTTVQGPLRLEGKGSVVQGGALAFVVGARIDPDFRAALEPLLRLIAVERGDGGFELKLS